MSSPDDLSYLATLEPHLFEAERCKLIQQQIDLAPPEHQKKLRVLQMHLDMLREQNTPEQFTKILFKEINESIENLGDLWVAVTHKAKDTQDLVKHAQDLLS